MDCDADIPLLDSDFFDRQRCVSDWNHSVIEKQVALVLGAGGIGCSVAMGLCRLGIRKIILLDNDVVEASNLNRQILFSKRDIGRPKVLAARDCLEAYHAVATKVEALHVDALKNWDTVVTAARESTVVFNNIDVGSAFDYAVASLCLALDLPVIQGSTYANNYIGEANKASAEKPCWACFNTPTISKEKLAQLSKDRILTHASLEGIVENEPKPETRSVGSSVLPCTIGSLMLVNAWVQGFLFPVGEHTTSNVPSWSKTDLRSYESFSFPIEKNPDCILCGSSASSSADSAAAVSGVASDGSKE